MKSLGYIINVISTCVNVPAADIIVGTHKRDVYARKMLCHIVINGYPSLERTMTDTMDISTRTIYEYASEIACEVNDNIDTRYTLNVIRRMLGQPMLKTDKRRGKRKHISDTKRLFGFDYTAEDVARRYEAMVNANIFMKKFCSLGRPPMSPGMVFPRTRGNSRTYKTWYNNK